MSEKEEHLNRIKSSIDSASLYYRLIYDKINQTNDRSDDFYREIENILKSANGFLHMATYQIDDYFGKSKPKGK